MASNDNKSKLHLGSFDSERFWRAPTLSQLPSVVDAQADAIVAVMDELMFAACHAEGGLLVTRRPMDKTHVDYLRETGFRFSRNEKPVETDETISGNDAICGLLQAAANRAYFSELFSGLGGLSPYSVLPTTQPFCQHYGIAQKIPSIEAVRKANSKLFSHALEIEELGEWHGETIDSAAELEKVGKHLLKNTTILIKDDFGVSGKGNLLVDSPQLLERISRHIGKQEKNGKQTRFLLEPLLDKALDFSCQLEIGPTGEVTIISVQKMVNAGFAFSAIQTAEPMFMEGLDKAGYLDKMQTVAAGLYREGYFGPVCIDSMLLKDGSIRSLVEINARQSMGFINHHIDRFLEPFSIQGSLLFFSLGLTKPVEFDEVLHTMREEVILFQPDRPEGILPLSAHTLSVNRKTQTNSDTPYKGRFYASLVATDPLARLGLKEKMEQVFAKLGIRVFTQ